MKINLEIDLLKLDKSKIIEKAYKDKNGNEVKQKLYKADLVDLNEPKFVTEGETWRLMKTHFIADPQTKEEREARKPANYIGSGLTFEDKRVSQPTLEDVVSPQKEETINLDDIPF